MCWRRRGWMPIAAMSPCRGMVTAWTCIMAAMILPIRTGLFAPPSGDAPKDTASAHSADVLSRHGDSLDLHYGRDDFANQDRLVRTLSRDRAKDMASDYERADPV